MEQLAQPLGLVALIGGTLDYAILIRHRHGATRGAPLAGRTPRRFEVGGPCPRSSRTGAPLDRLDTLQARPLNAGCGSPTNGERLVAGPYYSGWCRVVEPGSRPPASHRRSCGHCRRGRSADPAEPLAPHRRPRDRSAHRRLYHRRPAGSSSPAWVYRSRWASLDSLRGYPDRLRGRSGFRLALGEATRRRYWPPHRQSQPTRPAFEAQPRRAVMSASATAPELLSAMTPAMPPWA